MAVRGSCLCGDVAYQVSGVFELMSHCHCSMCRKAHGSAFATYVATQTVYFQWLRREVQTRRYESSPGSFRVFCPKCGSVVPNVDSRSERVFVPAGCLDDDPGARPLAHIFVESKAPWHEITDTLPNFAEFPPGFGMASCPSPRRASAGRSGVVRGSCLCGEVAYEAGGHPEIIVNCHCSRDRKARSAAYASDMAADPAAFRWLQGDQLLQTFKLPAAERFTTCFCSICGASLPVTMVNAEAVVIPAGSLDEDPRARPRCHIFCGSKAPWFEISDNLPRFDEYPPDAKQR